MKSRLIALSLAVTVICTGIACAAVAPGQVPAPLAQDEPVGNVTVTSGPYGETIVTFADRPNGNYHDVPNVLAVAHVGVASGAFVGDYVAADIVALKYKVKSDGHVPLTFKPLLVSGSRKWVTEKNDPPSGSEWIQYEIGFDRAADGWHDATWTLGDDAWAQSVTAVDSLGLTIKAEKDALEEQVYIIKDFMLIDSSGTEYPGNLSPLGEALWARFGVGTIAEAQALDGDTDGDGVSDLDETLTGSEDGVMAEVVSVGEGGAVIKWSSIPASYRAFNIQRTDDLANGFTTLLDGHGLTEADVDVQGDESLWTDASATEGGPYFYRVVAVITEE